VENLVCSSIRDSEAMRRGLSCRYDLEVISIWIAWKLEKRVSKSRADNKGKYLKRTK
jgi:hypothetical protein